MKSNQEFKEIFGKGVKVSEPLSNHTTLAIGGPADFYIEVETEDNLREVVKKIKSIGVNFLLIGGGSNLLVNDEGYDGVIIANKMKGLRKEDYEVFVGSGTDLQEFIDFAIDNGLGGVEMMSGIPGTVGGAIYGNAGAYGQCISDHLTKVKVLENDDFRWKSTEDIEFGYRHSSFKDTEQIIVEAAFMLEKGDAEDLREKSLEIVRTRTEKYPPHVKCPGSFFKNIIAGDLSSESLSKIPEDKIMFGKIPTGYLMEAVGARGARRGDIYIAPHHGNLIINSGNGTAKEIIELAKEYKGKVKERFGIELEPEVQLIGFNERL